MKDALPQPVIVVQRQTVDWTNLSDAAFRIQSREFCKLWGKPDDYGWQLFRLWNDTFAIDYRQVRQQLKQISLENLQHASGVTFVRYEGCYNVPQQPGYYLFLDDDDWVDPAIVEHLSRKLSVFAALPLLLLWRSANMGSPNQEHVVFVWGMNGRCMTNNYAVHDRWLQPFSRIQEVLQHKDAQKVFNPDPLPQTGGGIQIPHLDCVLTVSNKSPISSVSLDRGLNGDLSPEKLRVLVDNYLNRMRAVQDSELTYMPWTRPLINKTLAVFDAVIQSARY